MKHLISFPPVADRTTPLVITTRRSFFTGESFDLLIVGSTLADFRVAGGWRFRMPVANYTITITEGSEDFISVGITLTTENTTTVPHIITETPMTITAMTTTTRLTFFATSTMTIGAEIITGAAKVNSHLPPSFPPPIFPQMRQMPKLALAANPRIFPSFPRRRESTRRRAANADGAKRHLTRRGYKIPV